MADLSHCPNCGTIWTPGAAACLHCGWQPPDTAWPPAPTGGFVQPPPPPPPGRLLTGRAWADVTLGVLASLLSSLLGGLGLVVMPILYFVLRPGFPVFARGIGYGLLGVMALILGAIAWCFASIFGGDSRL